MKHLLFFCLLLTFSATVCAQTQESYYDAGNKFYEAGDYERAIESYQKALDGKIKMIGVFNNLANIYLYQKKNYTQAEEICLEGLSYYPFERSLVLVMMQIDFVLGRIDRGIAKYVALSQQMPSDGITFPVATFEKKAFQKGYTQKDIISMYQDLLKINEKDYILVGKVAEHFKNTKQYQKALDYYLSIGEIAPSKGEVYIGIGTCYYNLGKKRLALDYFSRAKQEGMHVPEVFFEKLKRE